MELKKNCFSEIFLFQAFAELQTDVMCDLTAAIDDAGIPYQSKDEFVSRLLFRDCVESSISNGYSHSGMGIYSRYYLQFFSI